MRHAFKVVEATPTSSLPVLATAGDIREVVQLLKKKPAGITIIETSDAVRKRLFDPRRVAAYELWGIVLQTGDRIKLSQLGCEFAMKLTPEAQIYRVILDNTTPYRAVLEWIHDANLDLVTHADVSQYWQGYLPGSAQTDEKTFEAQVVSFFHLCHAAEIGMTTVGRKNQPSRLRVDREELAAHLRGGSYRSRATGLAEHDQLDTPRLPAAHSASSPRLRVLISTHKVFGIVDSIRDLLAIVDLDCEVVERDPAGADLVSDHIIKAMRRCDAGIIIVSHADCVRDAEGKVIFSQAVLIEIGAALVHFGRRLVVLCGNQSPMPFNLNDFCRYYFEGTTLTWETGLQLIKTVKRFGVDS
jgi:CAP12/Pycsar effector protein, TIR domain